MSMTRWPRSPNSAAKPGYFAPQQFDSEWNVEENRTWLGPETLAQLPDGVVPDAVVGGVGTGGTIVGVGQCFRERNPACRVVAVEPNESCTLMCGEVGRHLIEGIADGFVPGIFARHRHMIDEIVAVDSDAAISEMRRLAREFGLFVGPSSGAHLLAARELGAEPGPPARRHVLLRRGREVHQRLLPRHLTSGRASAPAQAPGPGPAGTRPFAPRYGARISTDAHAVPARPAITWTEGRIDLHHPHEPDVPAVAWEDLPRAGSGLGPRVVFVRRSCAEVPELGPSGVVARCVPGWGAWRRFAGRSWSVQGVPGAGLGCLQAVDEGVEAGGEPFVAVV